MGSGPLDPTTPALTRSELLEPAGRTLNVAQLEAWGEAFAKTLSRPIVLTLSGDLGAGKTTLARALCRGFGVLDLQAVTSPTFAILQHYETPSFVVVHADLYRLRGDSELDTLGWDEIVDSAQVLIVEWPERTTRPWPPNTVRIVLAHAETDADARVVTVTRV